MDTHVKTDRRATFLAVAGLMLVLFLVSMDQTIVATALPHIAASLQGFSLYSWVTTAYLLTETAIIPIAGKLGDLYGRKWVTIAGVAIFIGFSALAGTSASMLWLVIFRGLQGIGGGAIISNVFTLVADIFPDPVRRARYQGIFSAVFALSSVIAPFIGGILTDSLSWRAIFYVNVPIGILALMVLPRVLPKSEQVKNAHIDFLGAITIVVTIVSLLLALTFVQNGDSWVSTRVLLGLGVAILGIALFIPIELRAAQPIVPMYLFRNRTLVVVTGVLFLFGIGMFGVTLYTPLFVQGVLGQTATGSGTILLPLILTMSVMSIIVGQIIGRFGSIRTFMTAGMAFFVLGAFLLSTIGVGTPSLLISVYLLIIGIGLGMTLPVTTLAVQMAVEKKDLGSATSMTQFIRSIGSTVGTAVIAWLVTTGYTSSLAAHAPAGTTPSLLAILSSPNALISTAARNALVAAAQVAHKITLVNPLLDAARTALSYGIHNGMLFAAGGGVLGILVTLALPRMSISSMQAQLEGNATQSEDASPSGQELVTQ